MWAPPNDVSIGELLYAVIMEDSTVGLAQGSSGLVDIDGVSVCVVVRLCLPWVGGGVLSVEEKGSWISCLGRSLLRSCD